MKKTLFRVTASSLLFFFAGFFTLGYLHKLVVDTEARVCVIENWKPDYCWAFEILYPEFIKEMKK